MKFQLAIDECLLPTYVLTNTKISNISANIILWVCSIKLKISCHHDLSTYIFSFPILHQNGTETH